MFVGWFFGPFHSIRNIVRHVYMEEHTWELKRHHQTETVGSHGDISCAKDGDISKAKDGPKTGQRRANDGGVPCVASAHLVPQVLGGAGAGAGVGAVIPAK